MNGSFNQPNFNIKTLNENKYKYSGKIKLKNNFISEYFYNINNKVYDGKVIISYKNNFINSTSVSQYSKEMFFKNIKKYGMNQMFIFLFQLEKFSLQIENVDLKFISLINEATNKEVLMKYFAPFNSCKNINMTNNITSQNVNIPFFMNGIFDKQLCFGIGNTKESAFNNLIALHYQHNFKNNDELYSITLNNLQNCSLINTLENLKKNNFEIYVSLVKEKANYPIYKVILFKKNSLDATSNTGKYCYFYNVNFEKGLLDALNNIGNDYYIHFLELSISLNNYKKNKKIDCLSLSKYKFSKINYYYKFYQENNYYVVFNLNYLTNYDYLLNTESDLLPIFLKLSFASNILLSDLFVKIDIKYNEFKNTLKFLTPNTTQYCIINKKEVYDFFNIYLLSIYLLATNRIQEFIDFTTNENIILQTYLYFSFGKERYNENNKNIFMQCLFIYMYFLGAYPEKHYLVIIEEYLENLFEKEYIEELKKCLNNPNLFLTTKYIFNDNKINIMEDFTNGKSTKI